MIHEQPPSDEEHQVRAARSGDGAAFEALYRAHYRRVYGLALRMCGRVPLAEELCQNTFVAAWEGLPSFRGESTFGTWLHGITVRTVMHHRRKERRRDDGEGAAAAEAFHVVRGDGSGAASSSRSDAWEAAVGRAMPETRIDLERAISALPERARAVLLLHDVLGYRQREVADQMRIAVGTVKAQLHRARRLLRAALSAAPPQSDARGTENQEVQR